MSKYFGIAAVQMSVVPWDVGATLDKMESAVGQVAGDFPWVDMIIFPELAASAVASFVRSPTPKPWESVADEIPGPVSRRFCDLARTTGKWIIPGSQYERADGTYYNTSLAISPQGEIVAKYRKIFPWLPFESESTPGDSFCVFEVPNAGLFGLCICYDTWFPEMIRQLAWMGADVIVRPALTPTSDRAAELILDQAHAIVNQCYMIDVNGVGPWGGGRSMIVDPEGRVLQQAGETDMILTEVLDLDQVKKTRRYGTLGLCAPWKQLRERPVKFPMYDNIRDGRIFAAIDEAESQAK